MQQPETVWTLGRLREWTKVYLAKKGCESAELETQVLMSHALQCSRIELFTRQDEEATEEGRALLRDLIRQRAEGCPVAYLVGHKEFFSLSFAVTPDVLIPRPDSEWLVYECQRLAKGMSEPSILDLGTGSGCLAVALAHQIPGAKVLAIDISADALLVAKGNAEKHGVSERITFLEGDLYSPVPNGEKVDFIVSNPPYIRTAEIETLQREIREHEPRLALDGGEEGFGVFDRIVEQASEHLKPGGYLIIEIGADQEDQAREKITTQGSFELAKTIHDANGLARALQARWTG